MKDELIAATYAAIDWSGRADDRGRTTWLAVVRADVVSQLENCRPRAALRDELIRLRDESTHTVVGIDFAFAFPAWYMHEQGWRTGRQLWAAAHRHGDEWLARAEPPFWGRSTKRPHHAGVSLRRTEQQVGGAPKSIFQIGGAGAVGTGSIRGMWLLHELAEANFAIWPFDEAGPATVIEIYPRLLTGRVNKSSVGPCLGHLDATYSADELPDLYRGMAAATEDAFDAAVSALEMARHAAELQNLQKGDQLDRLEGRIWAPRS